MPTPVDTYSIVQFPTASSQAWGVARNNGHGGADLLPQTYLTDADAQLAAERLTAQALTNGERDEPR